MVIDKADPQKTTEALKLGAHAVIVKRDIAAESLCRLVTEAAAQARRTSHRTDSLIDTTETNDAKL